MAANSTDQLKQVDEAYNAPSWWYDIRGFFILTLTYWDTIWHQCRFFSRNMAQKHLEVAIGSGSLLMLILVYRAMIGAEKVEIYGFDYAKRMIAGAQRRFRFSKRVHAFHADAAALDFPDNAFDSANIANAFHSFPQPQACMKELFRVLKTGGTMAVNVLLYPTGHGVMSRLAQRINAWGMRKGILYTPYTEQEARAAMEEAGFHIVQSYVKGNALNVVLQKP